MRVFAVTDFQRFRRKERIKDEDLCEAIERAERGLVDADLGGGLIKQRIARSGQGRSSGYRSIIACRQGDRAVFLFGFAKSRRANISQADQKDLADYGACLLTLDDTGVGALIADGTIFEINTP